MTSFVLWSGSILAAPVLKDATVVVLCAERHGAIEQARCSADVDVDALLRAEGARTVDAAQTERIRKTLDARALTSADGLRGIDLADADVILSVTIDVEEIGRVGAVARHDGRATVRLIDVPRGFVGPVVAVGDVWQGTPGQVARAASKELFVKGRDRVVASLQAAREEARGVDVWIFDVPGQPELDIVDGALKGLGLERFKAVSFMKGVAKRRIEAKAGLDAEAVGRALGSGDAPVVVGGVSGGLLQLTWSPAARIRVGALVQSDASGAPPWLKKAQPDLIASALATTGWVQPRQSEAEPHDVILKVETTLAGRQGHRLAATLTRRGTGKRLAAGVAVATEAQLAATLERVVHKTVADFRAYLAAHPAELSVWQRLKDAKDGLAVAVTPTFAREGLLRPVDLATDVVARVAVSPRPDELRARVRLVDLTPFSRWSTDGTVALVDDGGASLLSSLSVTAPVSTRLEVEVEGRIGERLSRQTTAQALVLHPDTTIDLQAPITVGRLVQPDAAFARAWGREALAASTTTVWSPELTRAVAVLGAAGGRLAVRVATDGAAGRFAVLPAPTRVVQDGGGPAEAMVGVALSLLLAQGLDARVVRAGPELLVAVDAGLPTTAWELVALRRDHVVDVDGRLFLPFHPASLGGGDVFAGIRAGGAALARAGRDVEVALLPPSPSSGATATAPTPATPTTSTTSTTSAERIRVLVWDLEGQGEAVAVAGAASEGLARALSQIPGLNVLSRKDLKDILAVEATRQAVGCEDASCFAELAAAVGARYVIAGRVSALKGGTRADVVLLDTASLESLDRAAIEPGAAEAMPGAIARLAQRLALPILGRSQRPAPPDVTALAHTDALLSATKDVRRRVRLLAVSGDLVAARAAATGLPPPRRGIALAHLDLLEGRVVESRAALSTSGAPPLSAWLAAALAGDAAAAAALEPRLKGLRAVEVEPARRFVSSRASGPLSASEQRHLAALLPWP